MQSRKVQQDTRKKKLKKILGNEFEKDGNRDSKPANLVVSSTASASTHLEEVFSYFCFISYFIETIVIPFSLTLNILFIFLFNFLNWHATIKIVFTLTN